MFGIDDSFISWLTICTLISVAKASAMSGDDSPGRRARTTGIEVGIMTPGTWNAITDVPGVLVGHKTVIRGKSVRTGVTAILPHSGNIFREKVPASIVIGNGFGKLAGYTQVEELGNIETPVILTNTLSVGEAMTAVISYTLRQEGNESVRSVNAVVGETNDGFLNDIQGMHISEADVIDAIESAKSGGVEEGSVGAGTGTVTFGYKGGIGTSSRIVPVGKDQRYHVGVLVQTNYGGTLEIVGAPVGRELQQREQNSGSTAAGEGNGSCMIVVATDAPLSTRNLKRLGRRALLGLARTGSAMSNGSGDYVISFSTGYRIAHGVREPIHVPAFIPNDGMTPFFQAVMDAAQEAVYNSMFMATTVTGRKGRTVSAIPIDEVIEICKKYNVLHLLQDLPPTNR